MPDPMPLRSKNLLTLSRYDEELSDLQSDVVRAFDDKNDQVINLERYWRIFNCELTVNQAYNGNSQIYLPLVRDAIEARVTRFVNMLFPESEQHVEVINYGAEQPHALMALLNHYVKRADLRLLAPELLRNGEIEGHYTVYVDWSSTTRYVTKLVDKPVEIDGVPDFEQTYRDVEEEEVEDNHPAVEVVPAYDIAVFPVTIAKLEDAEFVAIKRRYTKGKVRQLQRDGIFEKGTVKEIMREWSEGESPNYHEDVEKKKIKATGIDRRGNFLICYEVYRKFKVQGNRRWCRLFMRGQDKPLMSFTPLPLWNDRLPILSMARTKVANSFWGKSPVDAVEQLQYAANDACNMAWDSAQYSLLPIVMTDPEKNPNKATMMLGLAAIWDTNPRDTQILSFPQLFKEALAIVSAAKSQIMESFGLNPAMMAQGQGTGKKPSQAQVAQENMVAMENTANEVVIQEEGIWSPLLHRFFEMDQQFRKTPLTVKIYGQLGIAAQMLEVPTMAWDDRYEFRWRGVNSFRSTQQTQQMIAGMNVLRGLPPVLPSGQRINLDPIVEVLVENTYGPRLAARILVDLKDQLSVDPNIENSIMKVGEAMPIHEFDDDQKHLQSHMQAASMGDENGLIREHVKLHLVALQRKQQQPFQAGQGGQPQQGGPPRMGAQPAPPRGGQAPPGAIHQDQISDPSRMPRPQGTLQ